MTTWEELPLTPEHAAWLDAHAITPDVAGSAELRSITSTDELPAGCRWAGERGVPGVIIPWRSPLGAVEEQLHPDNPIIVEGEPRPYKYVWPQGRDLILNQVRAEDGSTRVLLVEGTKQPLAAASYAPAGVDVYGMHGCRGWLQDGLPLADLAVVEGRDVIVVMDGDVTTNLEVWDATEKLGKAAKVEGASTVRFVILPTAGKAGLDDLLARTDPGRRGKLLENLLRESVVKLPGKPRAKKRDSAARVVEPAGDRPQITVNRDRLLVINDLTRALLARWDAREMFNYGDTLAMLGTNEKTSFPEMRPITRGTFLDVIARTAACVTVGKEDEVVYGWPDGQSIDATLSRHRLFTPLHRLARAPFVRPDGSICQVDGYDPATKTLIILDPDLGELVVPDEPTDEEVSFARKLLLDDWLGDMPFASEADRANALALVLTPFVRGHLDVVPLAVVDGLQMGVGKNLFADVVHILATGSAAVPLPFSDEDEEVRKLITSAFRGGADLFVFDEAHAIDSAQLARALTAATYTDRQLGVSHTLEFPNQVTWISLGNRVRVEGDVVRRVYRIALHTTGPNPQDRPATTFRHPDLRGWTRAHRGALLVAALTLVRAWFASGQPVASKGVTFGSFEHWDRIVGGIVERAGVPGFLTNLQEWRSESNFAAQYWTRHLGWLRETFGAEPFTCSEVRSKLIADRDGGEPPPDMTDVGTDHRAYTRKLGQAYARMADRYFGSFQLVKSGTMHNNVGAWRVVSPDDLLGPDVTGTSDVDPDKPVNRPGAGNDGNGPDVTGVPDMPADFGDTGGNGGNPYPTRREKNACPPDAPGHTRVRGGQSRSIPPVTPLSPNLEHSDDSGTSTLANQEQSDDENPANQKQPVVSGTEQLAFPAEAFGPGSEPGSSAAAIREWFGSSREESDTLDKPAPDYPRIDLASLVVEGEVELPDGVIVFDIESDGERLWPIRPDFIRIVGWQAGRIIRVTSDAAEVVELLRTAKLIIGHNIMSFDLVAFALHHGIDLHELAAEGRVIDTMLTEVLINPPEARTKQGMILRQYSLDALGLAKFGVGKTDDLKALAKRFGGFGSIPLDSEEYARYCAGDVGLTARVAASQKRNGYVKREHRIAAIAAQIRLNGFRVDLPLLAERVQAGRDRRAELIERLVQRYGLPLVDEKGRSYKSPHATKLGKLAIEKAFSDLGVELERTPKGDEPALGKDAIAAVIEQHADEPAVVDLAETVGSLNGIRSVYETVERCRVGDRVHPDITMFQSSGRWSITEPGLTVMGKRGGKYVEREIFIPEEGHVIIAADLAQVDARAVAAWCQDPAYMSLFDPGRDSHTEIAVAVWGDPGRRDEAKILGHGWNYGMGLARLADMVGSYDVAVEFDHSMKQRFPGLVAWKRETAERADSGQLLDNGFGRLLRTTPGFGWTQGPALLGQSAARDIMMEGLLRLPAELRPYLRAVVHDEIVLSIPADQADEIEAAVLAAMSFDWAPRAGYTPIHIEAGVGKRGRNWGEVYAK
jgi:hypothetical protein